MKGYHFRNFFSPVVLMYQNQVNRDTSEKLIMVSSDRLKKQLVGKQL